MKKLLLILFAICPLFAFGQVTEAQKQEALAAASNFCSLLAQFSNGGVTHLSNDQKIFSLCSTPKISTYDDISKKEVMLNAYLALITKKYKNHLKMDFSELSISEVYYKPTFSLNWEYWAANGDNGNVVPSINKERYTDIYILVKVRHTINSLKVSQFKQAIYSVAEHKIISFSTKESPYVNFCKAIELYSNGKYQEATNYCDLVLANERYSNKTECANLGIMCSIQLRDINQIYKYTPFLGEQRKNTEMFLEVCKALDSKDYKKQYDLLSLLADSNFPNRANCCSLLAQLYAEGKGCPQSSEKALYWFKKAIDEGCADAGYYLWKYFNEDIIVGDDAAFLAYIFDAIYGSAKRGYVPAFYGVAFLEGNQDHDEEEGILYKTGAEAGDLMGMIYYGCWLSADKNNKTEALKWLKQASASPNIESYLDDYSFKLPGISNADEINKIIYYVEHDIRINTPARVFSKNNILAGNESNPTPSPSSTQNNTSAPTPPTTNTNNVFHSKPRANRDFNMPFDEQGIFGFSVGYVQKQWVVKEDGETTKMGYWDDTKYMSGIQAGFRFEPLFKYGFGIDTGLYYEYYYSKSKTISYEGNEFEPSINEHSLYLPIHLEYRLNFSSKFQLFFYGGVGLDYVLSAKLKTNRDDLTYDEDDAYENSNLRKFNTSLEYGGGIRVYGVQLNFTLTNGLMNIYKESDANIKQQKNLMCSLSYMF